MNSTNENCRTLITCMVPQHIFVLPFHPTIRISKKQFFLSCRHFFQVRQFFCNAKATSHRFRMSAAARAISPHANKKGLREYDTFRPQWHLRMSFSTFLQCNTLNLQHAGQISLYANDVCLQPQTQIQQRTHYA